MTTATQPTPAVYRAQVRAVHTQAATLGVANPNGFARWTWIGGEAGQLRFAGGRAITVKKPKARRTTEQRLAA